MTTPSATWAYLLASPAMSATKRVQVASETKPTSDNGCPLTIGRSGLPTMWTSTRPTGRCFKRSLQMERHTSRYGTKDCGLRRKHPPLGGFYLYVRAREPSQSRYYKKVGGSCI